MRKYWCIALCVLAASLAATDPLEVVQMSANEIVLRFTMPAWEFKDTANGQEIVCEGSIQLAAEGKPVLPFFGEAIGLPVDGSFTVEVTGRKTTEVNGVDLRPAETMVLSEDDTSVNVEVTRNQQAYRSTQLYPAMFTDSSDPAYFGNRYFAGLRVYPFQYRAGSQTLLVTTEATLRVRILGNTSPTEGWQNAHGIADNGSGMFINDAYSRKWRKPLQVTNTMPAQRSSSISEIQFIVDADGIYKITYDMLADSIEAWQSEYDYSMAWGVNSVDPRRFEMYDQNGQIPIYCEGEADGSFGPDDYIEFYGERLAGQEGYYGAYTSENVYTLRYTDHLGARLAVENGGIEVNDPSKYTVPEMFKTTAHLEEQHNFSRLGALEPNGIREDMWFWTTIYSPNMEIVEFNLPYPAQSTTQGYTARVMLMGSTHALNLGPNEYDHHAEVRLNTSIIGNHYWCRQREQLFENSEFIANSRLNNGTNTLYISLPGDVEISLEQVLLDYLDLTYWREYKTDDDILEFTKPSFSANGLFQFELDNFSTDDISLYKLGSSVIENFDVTPFTESGSAPYKVTFQDVVNSDDVRYYAVAESAKKTPKRMRPNLPSALRGSDNIADYVIITPQRFVNCEGTQLIKSTWEQNDQSYLGRDIHIQVVGTEDIYDEFSNGIYDPQAIKDFLAYAYNNWNYGGTVGRLEYVLLLGEGTYDERDDSAAEKYNLIPVKHRWASEHGATASDNWYVAIVGTDALGDLSIGRICVWTEEQILTVANKLVHYIEEPAYEDFWHGRISLAAGYSLNDGTDVFAQQSEEVRFDTIPMDYDVGRIYTRTDSVSSYFQGTTYTLLDEINTGTSYLQFMGHGGGQIWADNGLLDFKNIERDLTNDKYPFVVSLACYCSAFDIVGTSCIGEAFVIEEDKGAIGHLGFSGLGYLTEDLTYSKFLNDAIFNNGYTIFGDAVAYTRAMAYAYIGNPMKTAFVEGSILTGDPLVRLREPEEGVTVTLDHYNVQEGDSITITASFPSDITLARMMIVADNDVIKYTGTPIPVTGGVHQYTYTVPTTSGSAPYSRRIKVYGVSANREVIGSTLFTVGCTAVMNVATLPESPTESDSVYILANFFDEDGLDRITCRWEISGDVVDSLAMIYDSGLGTYRTAQALPAYLPGDDIYYFFRVFDRLGNEYKSDYYSYTVGGPDLGIVSVSLIQQNRNPAMNLFIENQGNTVSIECPVELYRVEGNGQRLVLVSTTSLQAIEPQEQVWFPVTLPISSGAVQYSVYINRAKVFKEPIYTNNIVTRSYSFNYQVLDPANASMTSLDGNAACTFPTSAIPSGTVAFINRNGVCTPLHENDIVAVTLASDEEAISYEIGLMDSTVYADSTGLLPAGATMLVKFYISPDSAGGGWSDEDTFGIYRWNEEYSKWIFQGGQVSPDHDVIAKYVNHCGIYGVFRNHDDVLPAIDANVEEQEFTYGGYISGKGTISLVLSDENGIDVVDNPPSLYLDGVEIPSSSYHMSASPGQLISVPIKYQLNLDRGTYTLLICCSDVNGNYSEKSIPFIVNTTFGILNLANYPNPVMGTTIEPVNEGRTRFTYVLTDDADKVTLKVYTVSGRLVKTFRNLPASVGYHEYPRTIYGWDCRDEDGQYLANGVYFYRLSAKRGNKTVEKIQKMAILR